jgi:hypothetical protein
LAVFAWAVGALVFAAAFSARMAVGVRKRAAKSIPEAGRRQIEEPKKEDFRIKSSC